MFELLFGSNTTLKRVVWALICFFGVNMGYSMVYPVFFAEIGSPAAISAMIIAEGVGVAVGIVLAIPIVNSPLWRKRVFTLAFIGWMIAQLWIIVPGSLWNMISWNILSNLMIGIIFINLIRHRREKFKAFKRETSRIRDIEADYSGIITLNIMIWGLCYPLLFRFFASLVDVQIAWMLLRILVIIPCALVCFWIVYQLRFQEVATPEEQQEEQQKQQEEQQKQQEEQQKQQEEQQKQQEEQQKQQEEQQEERRPLLILITLMMGVTFPGMIVLEAVNRASKTMSDSLFIGGIIFAYTLGDYLGGKTSARLLVRWNRSVIHGSYLFLAGGLVVMWWSESLFPMIIGAFLMGFVIGLQDNILQQELFDEHPNKTVAVVMMPLANNFLRVVIALIMWGVLAVTGGFEAIWLVAIPTILLSFLSLLHPEWKRILDPSEEDLENDRFRVTSWREGIMVFLFHLMCWHIWWEIFQHMWRFAGELILVYIRRWGMRVTKLVFISLLILLLL